MPPVIGVLKIPLNGRLGLEKAVVMSVWLTSKITLCGRMINVIVWGKLRLIQALII